MCTWELGQTGIKLLIELELELAIAIAPAPAIALSQSRAVPVVISPSLDTLEEVMATTHFPHRSRLTACTVG